MTSTPTPQREYRQGRFRLPPGGTDLLIVRHGESQALRPNEPQALIDGQGNPPLDPNGHAEAAKIAARLATLPLAAIYVSTMQRTAQTAAPLALATGLTPVVERDLREVHLGEWEGGIYRIRVEEGHPDYDRVRAEQTWDVIPGAEPSADLAARLKLVVAKICRAHPDQRVVIVAHGGVIGMLAAIATGGRMFSFVGSDNASLTHIVVSGDQWILRRFNDTSHLDTDLDIPVEKE